MGCFCRQFPLTTAATAGVQQRAAAVALLLAGPPPRAGADGAEATYRAHGEAQRVSVVAPLAAMWPVEAVVTCEASEVGAWRRLLEPALPSLAAAEIALPPQPPLRREDTRLARRHCSHQFCGRYYLMHLHVFQSYLLLAARERAVGRRYAFVVKGRFDLTFRPGDVVSAGWLRALPRDAVAVPSLEFQWKVRWLEGETGGRPGTRTARWPNAMNDQLAFGRRAPMHAYFGLLLANRTSPGGSGLGRRGAAREAAAQAEAILADHCVTRGVSVLTVELQLAKPTDRQRRSAAVPWLSNRSCCFCFDASRGGVAGVGRELRFVAPAGGGGGVGVGVGGGGGGSGSGAGGGGGGGGDGGSRRWRRAARVGGASPPGGGDSVPEAVRGCLNDTFYRFVNGTFVPRRFA